jgi:hypothetical protein
MGKKEKDELYIIIKAKDLCDYIFTILLLLENKQ